MGIVLASRRDVFVPGLRGYYLNERSLHMCCSFEGQAPCNNHLQGVAVCIVLFLHARKECKTVTLYSGTVVWMVCTPRTKMDSQQPSENSQ